MNWRYPSFEQVVDLHHRAMMEEGQAAVLAAPEKLESALYRPQAEAFGEEFYPTLAEKAAALLQGVVIAHPFVDGNKRAGVLAMLALLAVNGVEMVADEGALYDLVIAVTTGELREVDDIAARIRELFGLS
ncbi:MAG: type II toxin-antitoxin system death-on-curing family toxin [Dehalococcoidia bacterium]